MREQSESVLEFHGTIITNQGKKNNRRDNIIFCT